MFSSPISYMCFLPHIMIFFLVIVLSLAQMNSSNTFSYAGHSLVGNTIETTLQKFPVIKTINYFKTINTLAVSKYTTAYKSI